MTFTNCKYGPGDEIELCGVLMTIQDSLECIVDGIENEVSPHLHYVLTTRNTDTPFCLPRFLVDDYATDLT